ncbi:hypothetical protein Cgig2_029464 [Carnegiea gigantea]|uniref:Uncharacterized protein n=1 Tax=Carnegiea gigantea TaxID=171969 RepID=A0A9Q1QK04_9CARY|nr:hypothetical protein Cgig2_029464 [Carnegiea gigantea]
MDWVESKGKGEREDVRVKKKTLKAVLEQCQRALESLNDVDGIDDDDDDNDVDDDDTDQKGAQDRASSSQSSSSPDHEAEELCILIKSRVQGPEFIEKMENAQFSVQQNIPVPVPAEEGSSWDMVNHNDLWEDGDVDADQEDYIVVRQEDIVDGIACFMAAYLLSLKETKDLTPNQVQEALSKTFSAKKKKGKLRKALDGSKVIYNVASWSATAIG